MNIYRTEFFARCPVNDIRIKYSLAIRAENTIEVESILNAVNSITGGFHEDIANQLSRLGGTQTLTADHHGVTIETERTC